MSLLTSLIKKDPEEGLKKLSGALQQALGGRLKSIILFGSFVSSGYDPEKSDINVLVVSDLSYDSLELMRPPIRDWMKKGHAAPVMVAPDDLDDFARDFPIEFVDMQSRHRVLLGQDVLLNLKVNKQHLESQVEHDLALIQLKLRQALTAGGEEDRDVRRVFEKASSSIHVLVKTAVLMAEEKRADLDRMQTALREVTSLKSDLKSGVLHETAKRYLSVIDQVLADLRKN